VVADLHLAPRPGTDAAIHKPFGDVGVNFGQQQPGATVLWARLDVVVTDDVPLPIPDPAADPSAFRAAEAARPDSFEKLMAGTDPHVARVTLKPCSWACRAVDSTPALVAMPAMTTWVMPSSFRYASRSVFMNAPHVRLVTVWSAGC